VRLVRSKTDQEGQGRVVGIPFGGRPGTCPVRAVQAWQSMGLTAEAGAVFEGLTKGGLSSGKRLSGYEVARIVKRRAESAGLDAERLAGHSLRAGLVTTAVRAVMQHTGHSSHQMLRRYIRELGVV
jgi:integrase